VRHHLAIVAPGADSLNAHLRIGTLLKYYDIAEAPR
jgi:hypothetical protein